MREQCTPAQLPDLPTLPVDMTWFSFEESLAPLVEAVVERAEARLIRLDWLWAV